MKYPILSNKMFPFKVDPLYSYDDDQMKVTGIPGTHINGKDVKIRDAIEINGSIDNIINLYVLGYFRSINFDVLKEIYKEIYIYLEEVENYKNGDAINKLPIDDTQLIYIKSFYSEIVSKYPYLKQETKGRSIISSGIDTMIQDSIEKKKEDTIPTPKEFDGISNTKNISFQDMLTSPVIQHKNTSTVGRYR